MPADPQYDKVSQLAKPASPYYGCHNKPRPVANAIVRVSACFFHSAKGEDSCYTFRHSTECKYDQSHADQRCNGCKHVNSL